MIGRLPTKLEVDGRLYDIRTDYRDILIIFQAWNDSELTKQEKIITMLKIIYKEVPNNTTEAIEKAIEFINCNKQQEESKDRSLFDWEQDEQIIFSAVNKVAGKEVRNESHIHWWTFLGLFNSIEESLFTTVISIRDKKVKGKKLDKYEQEFYEKNKNMITLKKKRSREEQENYDRINKLFS